MKIKIITSVNEGLGEEPIIMIDGKIVADFEHYHFDWDGYDHDTKCIQGGEECTEEEAFKLHEKLITPDYPHFSHMQSLLAEATGCEAQYGGYPCNSCFHSSLGSLKLSEDVHEYWVSVLGYRGDYDDIEVDYVLLKELYSKLMENI